MKNELVLTAREQAEALRIIIHALEKAGIIQPHEILQIPRLLKSWDYYVENNLAVPARSFIRDGISDVGDPIVYQAMLRTQPATNLRPAGIATSFAQISIGKSGKPLWVPPAWKYDSYQIYEVVEHNEVVYENTEAFNMKEPGTAKSGWVKKD